MICLLDRRKGEVKMGTGSQRVKKEEGSFFLIGPSVAVFDRGHSLELWHWARLPALQDPSQKNLTTPNTARIPPPRTGPNAVLATHEKTVIA
jgi:hypothetical protein